MLRILRMAKQHTVSQVSSIKILREPLKHTVSIPAKRREGAQSDIWKKPSDSLRKLLNHTSREFIKSYNGIL